MSFNSNNFKFFTTVIEVFARSSMCTTIFQQRFSDFVVPSDSGRLNPNLDGSYSFRTCFGQFSVQAGPLVLRLRLSLNLVSKHGNKSVVTSSKKK